MRILLFGTPSFAATIFESLLEEELDIVGMVTQPDRPQGRRRRLMPSPVKALAVERGIAVLQPEDVNSASSAAAIEQLRPDVLLVAAYGQILSRAILDMPRRMPINVHPSLLPRWRGAAPIPWAIMSGDRETGITIIRMTEEMDAGDILAQEAVPIGPNETAGQLDMRLARLSVAMLIRVLRDIEAGTVNPRPQPKEGATFAPRLRKQDGEIDWSLPAHVLSCRIRGLTPWPGAYTFLKRSTSKPERIVIIDAATVPQADADRNAGTILSVNSRGILVATGRGALRILRLQPAGRRAMSVADFLNGRTVRPGDSLGKIA